MPSTCLPSLSLQRTAEDKAEPTVYRGARSLARAGRLPLSLLATELCFVLLADLSAGPALVSQSHSGPLGKENHTKSSTSLTCHI